MGLTELDIKKVIVNGDVKYKIYGKIFDSIEEAVQECIKIPPEIEAMSAEERRAAADEIAARGEKKTTKVIGLSR